MTPEPICKHCGEIYGAYCDCQWEFICPKCSNRISKGKGKCECMITPEPLNCPFCNSSSIRIPKNIFFNKEDKLIFEGTSVVCIDCGASGPPIGYVKDIIKAWNERVK